MMFLWTLFILLGKRSFFNDKLLLGKITYEDDVQFQFIGIGKFEILLQKKLTAVNNLANSSCFNLMLSKSINF